MVVEGVQMFVLALSLLLPRCQTFTFDFLTYAVQTGQYSDWDDMTDSPDLQISTVDDVPFAATGFRMPFFSQPSLDVYISANGFLTFLEQPLCTHFCNDVSSGQYMPSFQEDVVSQTTTRVGGDFPMIAAYLNDLNPGGATEAKIRFKTSSDRLVVEYFKVPLFVPAGSSAHLLQAGPLTVQVVCFTNGTIEMRFQAVPFNRTHFTGLLWTDVQLAVPPRGWNPVAGSKIIFNPQIDECSQATKCATCVNRTVSNNANSTVSNNATDANRTQCVWCNSISKCVRKDIANDACPVGFDRFEEPPRCLGNHSAVMSLNPRYRITIRENEFSSLVDMQADVFRFTFGQLGKINSSNFAMPWFVNPPDLPGTTADLRAKALTPDGIGIATRFAIHPWGYAVAGGDKTISEPLSLACFDRYCDVSQGNSYILDEDWVTLPARPMPCKLSSAVAAFLTTLDGARVERPLIGVSNLSSPTGTLGPTTLPGVLVVLGDSITPTPVMAGSGPVKPLPAESATVTPTPLPADGLDHLSPVIIEWFRVTTPILNDLKVPENRSMQIQAALYQNGTILLRYYRPPTSIQPFFAYTPSDAASNTFIGLADRFNRHQDSRIPWSLLRSNMEIRFDLLPGCPSDCGAARGVGYCDISVTPPVCVCAEAATGSACQNCAVGYYGEQCLACQCNGHGSCADGRSGCGRCMCKEPYTGESCQEKCLSAPSFSNCTDCACNPPLPDEYLSNVELVLKPPPSGGFCSSPGCDSTTCQCQPGWSGPMCADYADPCRAFDRRCHECSRHNCAYCRGNGRCYQRDRIPFSDEPQCLDSDCKVCPVDPKGDTDVIGRPTPSETVIVAPSDLLPPGPSIANGPNFEPRTPIPPVEPDGETGSLPVTLALAGTILFLICACVVVAGLCMLRPKGNISTLLTGRPPWYWAALRDPSAAAHIIPITRLEPTDKPVQGIPLQQIPLAELRRLNLRDIEESAHAGYPIAPQPLMQPPHVVGIPHFNNGGAAAGPSEIVEFHPQ